MTTQNLTCECFGDSGLQSSTHVPIGSNSEHCDLCGRRIAEVDNIAESLQDTDKPKFKVTLQYRSAKTYELRAADKQAAVDLASADAEAWGLEVIAGSAEELA